MTCRGVEHSGVSIYVEKVHDCFSCDIMIWLIGFMPRLTDSRCLALQKRIKETNNVLFHPKLHITVSVDVHESVLPPLWLRFSFYIVKYSFPLD